MSIITLLTDFGAKDEFVGVMKGVILSINPSAIVVDITHFIDPQNLKQGMYIIPHVYPYFPKGTVHVIVVDPGVGGDRKIIALKKNDHIFIAPDNGILTLLMDDGEVEAVVRVDNTDYFLHPVSNTFHGRDIFAPVSAHLSKGVKMASVGTPVNLSALSRLPVSHPHVSEDGNLTGHIIHVDRFGNLITNIRKHHLRAFPRYENGADVDIHIERTRIHTISDTYGNAAPGEPVAVFGSRGYLEISVNCGNASKRLNVKEGETVSISMREP